MPQYRSIITVLENKTTAAQRYLSQY